MKIKPTKKTYESDELVVEWQPSLCIHSEKCWRELPEVFRTDERPWVNTEGAEDKRIMKQLEACPSGALSGYWKNQKQENNSETVATQIEVSKNGPLMVRGNIEIKHSNGEIDNKEKVTAFCRCGASNNKPYCDGTHSKVGFEG